MWRSHNVLLLLALLTFRALKAGEREEGENALYLTAERRKVPSVNEEHSRFSLPLSEIR